MASHVRLEPEIPPTDDAPRRKRPARRDEANDDVIDFGQYEPAEEGSAVLSHGGRGSGPTSGLSIVSWDELARAHGPSEGDDFAGGDSGEIDFDVPSRTSTCCARSCRTSRRRQRSSSKTRPNLEMPAAADDGAYDAAEQRPRRVRRRRRPARLEGVRPGAARAARRCPRRRRRCHVPHRRNGGRAGEFLDPRAALRQSSDVWSESSRVDLLSAARPLDVSSGSLQHTDEVEAPPVVPPFLSGDSGTFLDGTPAGDPESSAVDLGSNAAVALPFPLGLDSQAGPSAAGGVRSRPGSGRGIDSGTVDLLDSSSFDLGAVSGMSSVVRQLRTEKDDLPPTTPLASPKPGRAGTWVGGTLVGLGHRGRDHVRCLVRRLRAAQRPPRRRGQADPVVAGGRRGEGEETLRRAGGAEETHRRREGRGRGGRPGQGGPRPRPRPVGRREDRPGQPRRRRRAAGEGRRGLDRARQANQSLAQLLDQLRAAKLDPGQLAGAAENLALARTAAEEVRKARAEVEALNAKVRAAELDPADLDASLKHLKEARGKAEAALRRRPPS